MKGFGPVVIKFYRRGGLLSRINQKTYIWSGKTRAQQELEMMEHVRRFGLRVPRILHSGKARAEQTAGLLAASVGIEDHIQVAGGIGPLDPVDAFARALSDWTEDTLVVGHLPFMGKLVSYLIVGNDASSVVAFVPGTVVCLERGDEANWSIAWMVRPGLAHGPRVGGV